MIKFEQFERDCPANARYRAKGETRKILRDFRVVIEGEHRATFHKQSFGARGYDLYWALCGNNPVRLPKHYCPMHADAKVDFESVVEAALKVGLIPTIAQQERVALIEEAEADHKAWLAQEADRRYRIEKAGPDLLAALREAREWLDGLCIPPAEAQRIELIHKLNAAIAKAEAQP